MKNFRTLKPREYLTTKGVVTRLIDEVGGVKHAAHLLERSATVTSSYSDPGEPAQITYDQVRRLTEARDATAAAVDLAALAGGFFTYLTPTADSLAALVEKSENEHGAFATKLVALLAKDGAGKLSDRDRSDLCREIDEMIRAYMAARLKLSGSANGR